MGRDNNIFTFKVSTFAISIHAPVWGATKEEIERLGLTIISIHAPVWGATHVRK